MYYILLVTAFNKACDKCFTSIFCFEVRIFSLSLAILANKRARKNLTCPPICRSNNRELGFSASHWLFRLIRGQGDVSHVLDHAQWIPGKILAHFDPPHIGIFSLSLAISANKRARRCVTCHMPTEFLVKFYPILTPHTCL